ncbi:hypothetical protein O6H91_09G072600 [Diphasiastrum complanatum]|uniref:Uncharacterized protein n=1 Tax=Diphasiastrum complanatum TaxID=34168 RepID=A0ACC2CQP8_DIPCM|nr:hypothetical protein O6H91_09G072600 [Diphasiastrum complanatum]
MSCSPASSNGTFAPTMRTVSSSESPMYAWWPLLHRVVSAWELTEWRLLHCVKLRQDTTNLEEFGLHGLQMKKQGTILSLEIRWQMPKCKSDCDASYVILVCFHFPGIPRRRITHKQEYSRWLPSRGDILAVQDMEMEDPCAAEISREEDCKVEGELGLEETEIESDWLDLDSSKTSLEGSLVSNIEDMEESDVYARFGIRNGRDVFGIWDLRPPFFEKNFSQS